MTGQQGPPLPRWKRVTLRLLLAAAALWCLAGMLTTRTWWLLLLYAAIALWCGLLEWAYAAPPGR